MNRYKKLKFVGEGSFARVYKVIDKKTQNIMALKCIKREGKSEPEIDKLMEEIMILNSLTHENIIKIFEWFVTKTEICVVTEYADKGELFKIIKSKENKLSEADIKIIAKQLVAALQFLHCKRIIHRDIKPQNILLSKHDVIKLCDFGFARALSAESTMATSIKGTPLYMAPELVQEKPYNDKVDLWSLGVILYELFYGKPPFYTNSIYKLVKMIVKDHIRYPINPCISKEFRHFISGLLRKNPLKRFDIEQLHSHPFLHIADQIAEQKDVEIVQNINKYSSPSPEAIKCSYPSSTKSAKSIKCTLSPYLSSTSDSAADNVKQKVFEILDSNDMSFINKILIVLPQRWQTLCSLSNGQNMQFELKLFQKLYILLTKTENNSFLKNIINVMHLTIVRMQKYEKYEINYVILQNTLTHITKTTYFHSCQLFPTICKLIKGIIHLKDEKMLKFMINEEFMSSFIFNNDLSNIANITNIIDIACQLIEYYPLHCYMASAKLKLNAFSKQSMSQIPIYKFCRHIQTQICKANQLSLFLKNILKQNSKYTLKFLLFMFKTSQIIRNNIENDLSLKRLLILYIYNKMLEMETEAQLNGLALLYHLKNALNIQTNEIRNIGNVLNKLSNSSNMIVSNLSTSILIINHKYLNTDYKILWQNNLRFIQTVTDLNVIFGDINNNIFDFWCNTLSVVDIQQNVKLSITISLQLFNILTKRIEYIINKDNNKDNKSKEYIISAQSLNIFLKFYYKILKILISDSCLSINQCQKNQLMKEFLCKNHIKTLSILGNPQFILEYISILPFYIDTLYDDLIECCDMSYSSILLIYRFLASQYSKKISSQKAFVSPGFNGRNRINSVGDNKIIYNFHKITLEFQLISSILNYIQVSPPKQKEECCNLLFYITWKQSLYMKEFLSNNGLLIITNSIIKQREYHSNKIIIQVLQIISCTARKYQQFYDNKQFYDKIESTGIFTLIPKYLLCDDESIEIKEKICNLIGNLCRHSDEFLNIIKRENLLKLLCECTENKLSTNMRRFACYAIGNIAYQSTKNNNSNNNNNYRDLIICIKPLALRLEDEDYKTQENAAGAIGNLVSQQSNNNDIDIIINEIIKNNVVKLLLNEIRINRHLCVIRNCLYSLSNICYFSKFKKSMIRYGWRHILKNCLDSYGKKDQFVKKCVSKIVRKMESNKK